MTATTEVFTKFKSYFQPALGALRRSTLRLDCESGRSVVVDIRRSSDLRSLRQLLILFEESGCQSYVRPRRGRFPLPFLKDLKWHRGVKLLWRGGPSQCDFALCSDDIAGANQPGPKNIHLRYDYGPKLKLGPVDFAMPFTMHPQFYSQFPVAEKLEEHRAAERKVRLLFAGNCAGGYDNPFITETFGKLTRHEVIEYLRLRGLAKFVADHDELQQVFAGDYFPGAVVIDTSRVRVKQRTWMALLAKADFFLCPPGVLMPMCHNMIESMAVGTIPFTNYADWYYPPVADFENCVEYTTLESFDQRLSVIFNLGVDQITALRRGVIEYYQRWLCLKQFGARLLNTGQRDVYLHLIDRTKESLAAAMKV